MTENLLETLRLDAVQPDDVLSALTTLFPRAETHDDRDVIYRLPSGDVGLTLTYRGGEIVGAEAGAGMDG